MCQLATRGEALEGVENMLAGVGDDPITETQLARGFMMPYSNCHTVSRPVSRPWPAAQPASRQSADVRSRRDIPGRLAHYKLRSLVARPYRDS